MRNGAMALFTLIGAIGCSEPAPLKAPSTEQPTAPEQPGFALAQPRVTMLADPPPPFTYWAAEGSTIRNHPNVPGIWIAELSPRDAKTYFGDACGASKYQHLVGKPWTNLTEMPPATEIRTICTGCPRNDDLRRGRINVAIDEATPIVSEIACF